MSVIVLQVPGNLRKGLSSLLEKDSGDWCSLGLFGFGLDSSGVMRHPWNLFGNTPGKWKGKIDSMR